MLRRRWGALSSRPASMSLRALIGPIARPQRRRLVAMSVLSVVGGFLEAGMLLVIARAAFALASPHRAVRFDTRLFGQHRVDLWVLLVVALVLIAGRMAAQWGTTVLSVRAST